MLSLWEAGINNTLIVFGLNLIASLISLLIKVDPDKIFISFNNDSENNNAGNKAALVSKKKLLNHFDPDQIRIFLPEKNDLNYLD